MERLINKHLRRWLYSVSSSHIDTTDEAATPFDFCSWSSKHPSQSHLALMGAGYNPNPHLLPGRQSRMFPIEKLRQALCAAFLSQLFCNQLFFTRGVFSLIHFIKKWCLEKLQIKHKSHLCAQVPFRMQCLIHLILVPPLATGGSDISPFHTRWT